MTLSSTMRTLIGGTPPSNNDVGKGVWLMVGFLDFLFFKALLGRGDPTRAGGVEAFVCGMPAVAKGGVGSAGAEGVLGTIWRGSKLGKPEGIKVTSYKYLDVE